MRRTSLIWGVALLALGGLMLADAAGLRLPNGNSLTSLFFPLLLIAFGTWVLFGVFFRRSLETESARVDLQGATEASLRINHGAGEFHLHSGASGDEFARGSFAGGVEQKTSLEGDRLHVKLRPATDFNGFGSQTPLDWDVALNAAIPTSLDMNLGANKSTLDLQDLKITGLRLKSGASDSTVTLPATGRLNADFEIGAASLTLIVPEGVAIRVHASIGVGDLNMDRARFPQNTSPNFDTAANAVDVHIKGGACSVKVK
jgi:hypothetical protein